MLERGAKGSELEEYIASARTKVMLGLDSLGCHYSPIPSRQIRANYAWGVTLEVEHAKGTTRLNIHFPGNFPFFSLLAFELRATIHHLERSSETVWREISGEFLNLD